MKIRQKFGINYFWIYLGDFLFIVKSSEKVSKTNDLSRKHGASTIQPANFLCHN